MQSPKQQAITLLKEDPRFSTDVVSAFAANIVDAPIDAEGNLDLPALTAQYKGDKLEVRSRKIRNITLNWVEVLFTIGTRGGGIEMASGMEHHHILGRFLEALNALSVLNGATVIKLGDKSAQIVEELWINRRDAKEVPEGDLKSALQDRISESELPALLGSLQALGILARENGRVIKRERFTLVA